MGRVLLFGKTYDRLDFFLRAKPAKSFLDERRNRCSSSGRRVFQPQNLSYAEERRFATDSVQGIPKVATAPLLNLLNQETLKIGRTAAQNHA